MHYDVTTIGDTMKDTFIFPSLEEMRKPVDGSVFDIKEKNEKFLIFGLGEKITVTETHEDIGGTACNVSVGLSRLKNKTAIISAIGNDQNGEEIKDKLKKEKVDISFLKSYTSRKTSFSTLISYKGERTILVCQTFEPDNFIIPTNLDTQWLYVGPLGNEYRKLYAKITGLAVEKNIKIAINPGAVQIHDGLSAFGALLSVAKIIFLNREEAQALVGIHGIISVKEIAQHIKKTGVEIVVITDGQNGAFISFGDDFLHVGTYPGTRVESTGAGDSFASAFLSAYIKGREMLTCLKWGAINSASVVGKYGAQAGLLSERQLEARLKEYKWPEKDLRFS
jgi:ribokinase